MTKLEGLYDFPNTTGDMNEVNHNQELVEQNTELDYGVTNVEPPMPGKIFQEQVGVTNNSLHEAIALENVETKVETVNMEGKHNDLLDEFLADINHYYQPEEMGTYNFLENTTHEFYVGSETVANQSNVKNVINDAFNAQNERISFAVEELGLHNRLTELKGVERDNDEYVLIKSIKGDMAVNKNRRRPDHRMVEVLLEEARECLRLGKRIELNLLETYRFVDDHSLEQERFRFRVSLAEIKDIIATTRMRGTITGDCFLVIYE